MQLTEEQIKHIAKLARLELSGEELALYGRQLSDVLNYIDQLKEVDTEGVEPTAQVTGLKDVFREDKVRVWDEGEKIEALKQAPDREGDFLKVKRVLE